MLIALILSWVAIFILGFVMYLMDRVYTSALRDYKRSIINLTECLSNCALKIASILKEKPKS